MKTGYHAVYENNFYEAIDHAEEYGFDFVQFDLGVPRFFLDHLSDEDLVKIRQYASQRKVEISLHSPGDNVSLFCDYPLIRKGIMDEFKSILEKANILGARHVTLHAGIYPRFKKSGSKVDEFSFTHRQYYEQVLYDNLLELIRCRGNVLFCLENYQMDSLVMDVAKKLIQEGQALYITLDTAKMYYNYNTLNDEQYRFMADCKDAIREMHIHDLNEQYGGHQIVGTGNVDFAAFSQFLRGDDVYINFEVRPLEAAVISRDRWLSHIKSGMW